MTGTAVAIWRQSASARGQVKRRKLGCKKRTGLQSEFSQSAVSRVMLLRFKVLIAAVGFGFCSDDENSINNQRFMGCLQKQDEPELRILVHVLKIRSAQPFGKSIS